VSRLKILLIQLLFVLGMTFVNLKNREVLALGIWNLFIKVFLFTLLGILLPTKILFSPIL
jgi:hypothetical protein